MNYGPGYHPMWSDGWHWFAGFHSLLWVALLIAGITALALLVRRLWHGSREHGSALQILEERYARGDLDREEFLQRRQDLT